MYQYVLIHTSKFDFAWSCPGVIPFPKLDENGELKKFMTTPSMWTGFTASIQHSLSEHWNVSKTKNLKRYNFGQSIIFERTMRSGAKLVEQSASYRYQSQIEWFVFVPNTSQFRKSEPAYLHSILMQEPKDMRKKEVEPNIYTEHKVTNNGKCVLDHNLKYSYRCHVTE